MNKRSIATAAITFSILAMGLAGCGSGSSHSVSTAPTATTRARVRQLFNLSSQSLTQAGSQTSATAASINAAVVTPLAAGTTGGVPSTTVTPGISHLPLIAAFLRNIGSSSAGSAGSASATGSSATTSKAVQVRHRGRQVAVSPPGPTSDFYFDYYLGLWVSIADSTGQSIYSLYVDQAQTQPAGSIVTIWPADDSVYPQTYRSTYTFTAGYLAGSHGDSLNVTNADGSSTASYNDTYADGSTDKGASTQTATGDYTWNGLTTAADGSSTTESGTFRSDGSGGTRLTMSNGYVATYVYNADGSGHGTITGPDPGLPVTITFNPYGDTTITYADGTTEVISGYGGGVATPAGTSGTTTSSSSGSGSTNTATAVTPPPTSGG